MPDRFCRRLTRSRKAQGWNCNLITIIGDLKDAEGKKLSEVIELWHRSVVECSQELVGKESIEDMQYGPKKTFVDAAGTEERIGESPTGGHFSNSFRKVRRSSQSSLAPTKHSSPSTVATNPRGRSISPLATYRRRIVAVLRSAHNHCSDTCSDEAEDLCEEQAEVRNLPLIPSMHAHSPRSFVQSWSPGYGDGLR